VFFLGRAIVLTFVSDETKIRWLVEEIRSGETTPAEAAENVARPCVCGIVNRERAGEVFQRLAGAS